MANPEDRQDADEGWKPLRDLATAIATIHPQNSGEAVIEAEMLKTWNLLYNARSARLSAVQGHIPGVIWAIVFFGAAITTGYTYFFGYEHFGMHLAMTATLAATLGLIIVMIIAVDLAVPRRDKRLARPIHNDPAIVDRGAIPGK